MDSALKKIKLHKPHQYDLAILGSILPDLEYTGLLPEAHARCKEFYEHLLSVDEEYVPLALGMVSHVLYDKIIEPGYVDIKESEAMSILHEFYPRSTKIKWAAHTFIEQAMDAHVLIENPQLPKLIAKVNKRLTDQQLVSITTHLATFFGADKTHLLAALRALQQYNVEKISHPLSISKLWLNCMFMMSNEHILLEHTKNPLAKFKAALTLGFAYSRFRMSHRLWHMFSHARIKFSDHKLIRKQATDALHLELKRLVARLPK